MKRRIMILGAGIYQVPLIKTAREMNLETIVVSPQGKYPGIPLADIFLDMDTTDADNIVLAAQKHGISGIVTTGTDVSVPSVGAVVDKLKLIGPTRKTAQTVSSKSAFRNFLKTNHLNTPEFKICECALDAVSFYQKQDEQIVIKPDDSSGSRGVTIIDQGQANQSVSDAYHTAKNYSRSGLVCAESFVPGTEVGGDAFLVNGMLRFFTTTCKHINGVIVQGHSLPGLLNENQTAAVRKEILQVSRRLGYENGPINFDVMVDDNKATILEMGLRNGGNGILDLIYHGYGVDLTKWLLAYALGDSVPGYNQDTVQKISSYVFGADCAGKLTVLPGLQELKVSVPEVFDMTLAKQVGDYVDSFVHNANLIGYVLMKCGALNYKEVVSRIKQVLEIKVAA